MVSQTEWSLINNIRESNDARNYRSREYVGVLYFLLVLEMLQVALIVGALQGYAFPLRRFYRIHINLTNNKVSATIHTVIVVGLYFVITGAAGASGYIFMSCLIGIWMAIMLVYILIRRLVAKFHDAPSSAAHDATHRRPSRGDVGASGEFGSAGGRRLSNNGQLSGSFVNDDSASFDQVSLGSQDGLPGLQSKMKKLARIQGNWAACPAPMANSQLAYVLLMVFGAVVVACIFIGVFFGWKVDNYTLIRDDVAAIEFQPELNGKSLQMLYAFPTIATKFHMQLYVKLFSEECGKMYSKLLADDAEKKKKIYDSWIAPYSINMSEFIPSDYTQYDTVDEWFVRAIDLSLRPLPASETAIVSPADCRLLVFEQSTDMLFYLKGYPVSITSLLNDFDIDGYPRYFENAAVVVARLAPQDYHRFHSPVTGRVVSISRISGTYWSVSADAARSGNEAFLNTRTVVVIDAGPRIGFVAYVAIGATCVGSVRFDIADVSVGSTVTRGMPLGSMHFGGSTVLMLFSKGRILFDSKVLQRSRFGVETQVLVNSEIGASR